VVSEPDPTVTATEDLDQLIPPPWSTARRAIAVAVVAAALAGALVVARSGVVIPRLEHGDGWGSTVDASDPEHLAAERFVHVRNAGWVEATVESLQLPPVDGVTWGEVDGLPTTIEPGGTRDVTVRFTVAGCAVDADGVDGFRLRTGSPFGPTVTVTVPAPDPFDPRARETHDLGDGDSVTLPEWPDQPPSWILDTIHAPCTDPPDTH
jgi:hypothetical protein